jgi:hypothetical protein
MEIKVCKVLEGTVEAPIFDNADFAPLSVRAGHSTNFVQAFPGELVNLPLDEADRLSLVGIVEIES